MVIKFNVLTLLFLLLLTSSLFISYIFWKAEPSKLRNAMLHYFLGASWFNLIFSLGFTYMVFAKPAQIKIFAIANIALIPFLLCNICLFGYFFVNYFYKN